MRFRPSFPTATLPSLAIALAFAGGARAEPAADGGAPATHPGAAIYQMQCVECHGEHGEGNELEEVDALYGDRSVASLTRLIERTMPEEDPETCVGDDARAVAQYIYDAFYSPAARERMGAGEQARVGLVRMTVPQYRNAVADLLGRFERGRRDAGEGEPGLRGSYFSSDGMNKKAGKPVERRDLAMQFDFGEGPPAEGLNAEQYSVVWEGSFFARETGHYEFRTTTPNGVRLYANVPISSRDRNYRDDSSGGRAALIDDWVSSGAEDRVSTARVYLLGGRRYPLRLDYFKYKEKLGRVTLEWKPPGGVWEVLGGDVLSTSVPAKTFVVSAPFPPDDRSQGYERGLSVSKDWHAGVTAGAVEVAREVVERIDRLSGIRGDDPERAERLKQFCARFVEAAFRRPIGDAEHQLYVEAAFARAPDADTAVKRCVLRTLSSPRFLYPELPREEGERPDGYAVASRLSFALWDSIPDETLLQAAEKGWLGSEKGVRDQAVRMVGDPRARAKLAGFFAHWLELGERDLAKDKALFPNFDEAVAADLRESLLRFVEGVAWGERSDYRELLLADYLVLNPELAKLYGASAPDPEGGFQKVPMRGARAGVLTHPYLLSAFAYHNNTSPIHRGVFLTRHIVGRSLKPPPVAVAFKDDEFDPDLTMREKVTQLTRDTACMSCHSVINPLGFSLENFDPIGRWRDRDRDQPVDPASDYVTPEGETVRLTSARDVARYAVTNPAAHRAFAAAMFHHLVKQPVSAYGPGALGDLRERFTRSEFNIRELMVEIATVAATHRAETAEAPGQG